MPPHVASPLWWGLLAVVLAAVWGFEPTDGAEVVKVALLHRHGARTPYTVFNGSSQCGGPFCELTDTGIYQSRAIGKYLRERYGRALNLSPQYNISQIHSQGTAVSRVARSASAVLMALFEGSETLPYIEAAPLTSDEMMSPWTAVPAWVLSGREARVAARLAPQITSIATPDNIAYLEAFYNMQCQTDPLLCVGLANDQFMSNTTAGLPINGPITAMMPQIQAAFAFYLSNLMGYFPEDDPMVAAVGSFGLPWVRDAVSFLQGDSMPGVSIAHYAAHDWTLSSVFATLGYLNATNMQDPTTIPAFASTLLLELWSDGVVRVLLGDPGQLPTIPFRLTTRNLTIRCANAGGVYYTDAGCPVADLLAGAELTAGQSNLGSCYFTSDFLQGSDCLTLNVSTTYACTFFRQKCPNVPCGNKEGALPDPARKYACQLTGEFDTQASPYVVGTMLAVIIPSLLVGGSIGGCGYRRWNAHRRSKQGVTT